MNSVNLEGKKEGNIVSVLLYRYLPYWPLFVILLLISLAIAWGYIQTTVPLFQASTTILLKDNKKGGIDSGVEEALNIFSSNKIVENEIVVLRSVKIMNEIINELHLYSVISEKSKFKNVAAYNSSPITILAKYPEYLKNTNDISFTFNSKNRVVINNKQYPLNQWVSTSYGELKFIPNAQKYKDPSFPLVFRLYNPKSLAYSYVSRLSISPTSKTSTVVNVTLKDEVPQRGEAVLNKLAEVYNRVSLEDKNKIALNTLSFLESRLNTVGRELDSLESLIQDYRTSKGVVNLSDQSKFFLQNVGENDRRVADVNLKLSILNEVEKYVTSKSTSSGIVPSTVGIEDPTLTQLVQRLYNTELEYEKIRKTTGENNPLVTPLANEIEQIRPQILENIRSQRNSLIASRNNLSATSGNYTSMLNSVPQKERELADISRQQAIKNNVYGFLLQKREQTALAVSSNIADSKVIDLAVSSQAPVSPRIPFIYIAAIVGALLTGILIVSGKEILNRKILFRSEIETFTHLPVVAEIANAKKQESLLDTKSKVSLVAEQFRQLRAAIGLYGKHIQHKRILVTSSISGEGKSYISTNLALSLALSGKKVALLDLDIRNPKVTSVLGLMNGPGIAEFLEGTKTCSEIIHNTSHPNLFAIGAGQDSDDAKELILSGKLNELLTLLDTRFDYIVMDTSPIDPVTDAYVFSEYCDRTLFVVRHRYTPKTIVQFFDENSKVKALKNPVIVFNDVRSRGFFSSTYGYGYGYGYTNVYRDKSRKEKRKLLGT